MLESIIVEIASQIKVLNPVAIMTLYTSKESFLDVTEGEPGGTSILFKHFRLCYHLNITQMHIYYLRDGKEGLEEFLGLLELGTQLDQDLAWLIIMVWDALIPILADS